MKLHEEQLLLVQDESVEYTASCGFWDSVHSPSSPSTNNTDSDTNNSGVQERLDDRGQFHLTKPTSSNPNRNRKRGRGRPRSGENPKRKRRKARVRIAIAPKLQVPKDSEFQAAEESFESFLDLSSLVWTTGGPFPLHHEMNISTIDTSGQSTSPVIQEANTAAMPRRRQTLCYDVRIDPSREVITHFNILMNSSFGSSSSFVESTRVLLSQRLRRSYMHESYLRSIGYSYTPFWVWKTTYHLGEFAPVSVVPLPVTTEPNGHDEPFWVNFHILPGSPPQGGVDFMIGDPDLARIYGQYWSPSSN